jgi:PadR family transcriptional regulator
MLDLVSWRSQLRKGAAELAVLAVLAARPRYGLEILDRVTVGGGLEISEGTLYPLLNRLQREEKVSSEWLEEEGASHPRKYYHLTPEGSRLLAGMRDEWKIFAAALERLLGEESP